MPRNSPYTLEICAATPSAILAASKIADRIELCNGLEIGGLTPDIGMMELAAATGIETHVLIRPRSGDFSMSSDEVLVAKSSIKAVRQLGLKGVVIGAEQNGALDQRALEAMVSAADGLDVTLHRVIDVVDDPIDALEVAIDLGAVRILSSGGKKTAPEGTAELARLHASAADRIEIMAGSGIKSTNIEAIMNATQITSFHASCTKAAPLHPRYDGFGFGRSELIFDQAEAEKLQAILQRHLFDFLADE